MDLIQLRYYRMPVADVLLAAVLAAMGAVLAVGNARILEAVVGTFDGPTNRVAAVTAVAAVTPLAFRRVFPLGSLLVITVGMLSMAIYGVVEVAATNIAAFVALVSAGIYGRETYRDWARGLFAVAIGAIFLALFISHSGFDTVNISPRLMVAVASAELAANVIFVGLGWFLGDLERRRRGLAVEVAERNAELQTALDQIDAQAANEERLAIAREVHDIVGHTVSLLGVQAAAARRQIHGDPDAAETILRAMEAQSRGAVDEISSLIAVLRVPVADATKSVVKPTPSVDGLDELIEQVRAAGAAVSYSCIGRLPDSAGLGLSLYRVVQEALSNAIRHGAGGVEVVLTADNHQVSVFVSNDVVDNVAGQRDFGGLDRGDVDRKGFDGGILDGGSLDVGRLSTGSGLIGMRERVGLHGGTLAAGRQQNGRFELRAVLSIPGGSETAAIDSVDRAPA